MTNQIPDMQRQVFQFMRINPKLYISEMYLKFFYILPMVAYNLFIGTVKL